MVLHRGIRHARVCSPHVVHLARSSVMLISFCARQSVFLAIRISRFGRFHVLSVRNSLFVCTVFLVFGLVVLVWIIKSCLNCQRLLNSSAFL